MNRILLSKNLKFYGALRSNPSVFFCSGQMENMEVNHDKKKRQFFINLTEEEGPYAVLDYRWPKKGVIDLTHTGVPVEYSGKGIAKLLAKAAFDYVVEKDAKMILTCSYLEKYYNDNPSELYNDRVYDINIS